MSKSCEVLQCKGGKDCRTWRTQVVRRAFGKERCSSEGCRSRADVTSRGRWQGGHVHVCVDTGVRMCVRVYICIYTHTFIHISIGFTAKNIASG